MIVFFFCFVLTSLINIAHLYTLAGCVCSASVSLYEDWTRVHERKFLLLVEYREGAGNRGVYRKFVTVASVHQRLVNMFEQTTCRREKLTSGARPDGTQRPRDNNLLSYRMVKIIVAIQCGIIHHGCTVITGNKKYTQMSPSAPPRLHNAALFALVNVISNTRVYALSYTSDHVSHLR